MAQDKMDPHQDRSGRGAGQPTGEPQTGRNESIKQSLALPSDRDESVAMTGSESNEHPDPQIEQAARDLAHGLKDTSRAPEMDRTYKKMSGKPDE